MIPTRGNDCIASVRWHRYVCDPKWRDSIFPGNEKHCRPTAMLIFAYSWGVTKEHVLLIRIASLMNSKDAWTPKMRIPRYTIDHVPPFPGPTTLANMLISLLIARLPRGDTRHYSSERTCNKSDHEMDSELTRLDAEWYGFRRWFQFRFAEFQEVGCVNLFAWKKYNIHRVVVLPSIAAWRPSQDVVSMWRSQHIN